MGLREASEADIARIVEMLADDHLGRGREQLVDLAPYRRAFAEIANDPNNTQYVWDENGEVVGCLQLTFVPGLSNQGAWRVLVEGVRTAGARRGQGIGRQMMQAAMRIARQRGCKIMQLTTDKSRVDAQRFYRKLGFVNSHEGMKLAL